MAAAAAGVAGFTYYYTCSKDGPKKNTLQSFLSPEKWQSVKVYSTLIQVLKSEDVNYNTKIITFALPHGFELGLPVSSCITVTSDDEKPNSPVKPYTPISDENAQGYFSLLVKKYENGPVSTFLHSLKEGDSAKVKGPFLKLKYEPNMKKEIGMIAGGTGVTPMIQVLKKILSNPEDKTKVTLLFANREERDILLKKELDELEKQHSNLQVHYTLDKPSKSWNGLRGYVSEDMIKKHLPSPSEDNLILICGPDGFLSHVCGPKLPDRSQGEIAGLLKKLGYTSNQIYKF